MNLAQLQDLYTKDGPFTSVHLDVTRGAEDSAHRIEVLWAERRAELSAAGAADRVLDRIGELVQQPTHVSGEARRTVVADDADVLFDDVRAGHGSRAEVSTHGPLPDLAGWLTQVDGELPFVLVLASKEGADVEFYRAMSKPGTEHETVHGRDLHLTKVPQGQWAELQNHTEEVWRRNARDVAEVVRGVWARHHPRFVVLAGDVRARADLRQALTSSGDLVVEEVDAGGRAEGSSTDALWQEITAVLGRVSDDDRNELIDALGAAEGQGRSVARGLHAVLQALVQGKVERLVLDLDAATGQTINIHDYSGLQLPVAAAQGSKLAADQVLVAAGASTDARLSLLPADVVGSDGVAAILRWDG